MSRHQTDPLRPLTADERKELTRLSRSPSAPAAQVERSRALLAIERRASYTAAAHQVGRRHKRPSPPGSAASTATGLPRAARPRRRATPLLWDRRAAAHSGRNGVSPAARTG